MEKKKPHNTLTYLLTDLFTFLLSPWSRILLEKKTGSQLVNKFPAFYGNRPFIAAFTPARHQSLSWTRLYQRISLGPKGICIRFVTRAVFTMGNCQNLAQPPRWSTTPLSALRDCLINIFRDTLHISHPAPCKMGTGSFPEVKCGRDVLLTTHPLLVPWSWKSIAIPLPTL